MARIRTIKPEFWTSEQVAECSPISRLLFVGIWNFSDDHGIHPASVKRLKMQIFPSDSITVQEIESMVEELQVAGLLSYYEVEGSGYWQVTGWAKHQKIEKPTYRHPLPNGAKPEPLSTTPPLPVAEKSPTPRPRNGMESKGSKALSGCPDVLSILSHLNDRAGKNFKPVPANTTLIAARIKEGATPDECRAVIDAKVREWGSEPTMQKYLRPETLFGATKFAGYVGQLSGSNERAAERGYI